MVYVTVVFTIAFIIFIEIFTIMFQLTGLSKQKAKFQVISILTGTGYTTKESELVTKSKIRRNIAQIIMIFGFVSSATIVTILFTFVKNFKGFTYYDLLFAITAFVGTYIVLTMSKFGKFFDKVIEKVANRALFGTDTNIIITKDSYDNDVVIAEVVIKILPSELANTTLEETAISRNGVMILAIERDGEIITKVTKDTILYKDDTITVFGPLKYINQLFYKSIKTKNEQ